MEGRAGFVEVEEANGNVPWQATLQALGEESSRELGGHCVFLSDQSHHNQSGWGVKGGPYIVASDKAKAKAESVKDIVCNPLIYGLPLWGMLLLFRILT
jgi:hypothetical protein